MGEKGGWGRGGVGGGSYNPKRNQCELGPSLVHTQFLKTSKVRRVNQELVSSQFLENGSVCLREEDWDDFPSVGTTSVQVPEFQA